MRCSSIRLMRMKFHQDFNFQAHPVSTCAENAYHRENMEFDSPPCIQSITKCFSCCLSLKIWAFLCVFLGARRQKPRELERVLPLALLGEIPNNGTGGHFFRHSLIMDTRFPCKVLSLIKHRQMAASTQVECNYWRRTAKYNLCCTWFCKAKIFVRMSFKFSGQFPATIVQLTCRMHCYWRCARLFHADCTWLLGQPFELVR